MLLNLNTKKQTDIDEKLKEEEINCFKELRKDFKAMEIQIRYLYVSLET